MKMPAASDLSSVLSKITAAGPHTRLGLTPRSGDRVWNYDSDKSIAVHRLPDGLVGLGPAATAQYVRQRPGQHDPIEVFVSDRQIVLDVDHGLGDGIFVLDLMTAIFDVAADRTSGWMAKADTRLILPRALGRTFGLRPKRAWSALRFGAGLRSGTHLRTVSNTDGISDSWSPSLSVTVAHVGADAELAVDEWRRANIGTAGTSAVWLHVVREAMRAAGLPTSDRVMVLWDCRRYLPGGQAVHGNFLVGVELPHSAGESLRTVISRIRESTVSGFPLAVLGLASARTMYTPPAAPVRSLDRVGNPIASVVYTDMGRITALDALPWWPDTDRCFTGLLDPSGPDGVTVFNTRLDDTRNIAITYHDNVFDTSV
ncbi:MAG: hypothetical protein WA988_20535, partial [Candidatus Nanopelagicales bacterium]